MSYNTIIFEKEDHIGIVTLNRPQMKNAVSLELMREISDCFDKMTADKDIRAVVITGGPQVFSAGFDLPMAITLSDEERKAQMLEVAEQFFLKVLRFRAPVIAAVSGPALAAGFDLQVMADVRIYSETARVGQVEIDVAVTALVDPLWKIVGLGRMKELVMTGRVYGAEEAYRIGLANHVYPVETFLDEAKKLARLLACKHQPPLEAMKEQSNRVPGMELELALRTQLRTFRSFVGSPAMVERMQAFLDKSKK